MNCCVCQRQSPFFKVEFRQLRFHDHHCAGTSLGPHRGLRECRPAGPSHIKIASDAARYSLCAYPTSQVGCMGTLPRFGHQCLPPAGEQHLLILNCPRVRTSRNGRNEFIRRSIVMRRDVMNDQLRADEYDSVIGDEQISVAGRRIVLTEFTVMNAAEHHWLPQIIHQALEFGKRRCISRPGRKSLVVGEPSHREERMSVLRAEVVACGQVSEMCQR